MSLTDKQKKQFRKMNNIPDYEVWDFYEGEYDGVNFNQKETLRNFMKIVIEKLEKLEKQLLK